MILIKYLFYSSSIKEEPAIISPNNSPQKQNPNSSSVNQQQSKIEYQNSAGGSIRSSSTISSTGRSNRSVTVQNVDHRLPRFVLSLL